MRSLPAARESTPSKRYRRVAEIFLLVCDLPAAARRSELARSCEGDEALRADVEDLLRFHDRPLGSPPETQP